MGRAPAIIARTAGRHMKTWFSILVITLAGDVHDGLAQSVRIEPALRVGAAKVDVTWASLGQTPVQAQQWEKLGHTPETAKPIIENRFDYTVDPVALIVTVVVIVGYFVFVFRISDREYREVVRERFGDGSSGPGRQR